MSSIPFEIIVFDFDGTLVQSAEAKRKTFFDVFPANFAPAVAAVLELDPDGSRHRVIPAMIAEAERLELPAEPILAKALVEAYGVAAVAAVAAAPEMPGASRLLQSLQGKVHLYVISVTPQEDLIKLLEKRRWLNLFSAVYGFPHDKAQTIASLLTRHGVRPSRLLMVGDGENDAAAAARNGCRFHRISRPEDLLTFAGLEHFQNV